MGVCCGGTKPLTVEEAKIRDQKMKEAWSSQLQASEWGWGSSWALQRGPLWGT